MKTLQIIKDEYAKEIRFQDWNDAIRYESFTISNYDLDIISKRFAIEVANQALINASVYFELESDMLIIVNESNIPKL